MQLQYTSGNIFDDKKKKVEISLECFNRPGNKILPIINANFFTKELKSPFLL